MTDKARPSSARPGTGRNRRQGIVTMRQREVRERAFYLHLDGWTVREIGVELGIDKDTAAKYVRVETELRRQEFDANRDQATFRSVAFNERVKKRAMKRAAIADEIMEGIVDGTLPNAKVSDHSFADAIKAQERIDKVLGVDAPLKVEAGIDRLVEALLTRGDSEEAEGA